VLAVIALVTRRRWLPLTRGWWGHPAGLAAAAAGLAVVAVLGSLLNDSGIAVACFVTAASVPAVLAAELDRPSVGDRSELDD